MEIIIEALEKYRFEKVLGQHAENIQCRGKEQENCRVKKVFGYESTFQVEQIKLLHRQ